MSEFDASRAWLRGADLFKRFVVPNEGTLLKDAGLAANDEVLFVERGGRRLAFELQQISYHHCAQGELAGQPYVVSF